MEVDVLYIRLQRELVPSRNSTQQTLLHSIHMWTLHPTIHLLVIQDQFLRVVREALLVLTSVIFQRGCIASYLHQQDRSRFPISSDSDGYCSESFKRFRLVNAYFLVNQWKEKKYHRCCYLIQRRGVVIVRAHFEINKISGRLGGEWTIILRRFMILVLDFDWIIPVQPSCEEAVTAASDNIALKKCG